MSKDLAEQYNEQAINEMEVIPQEETQVWDLHEGTELVPLEFTEENNLKTLDQQIEAKAFQGLVSIEAERDLLIQSSINALTLEINAENMEVFEDHSKKWLKMRTQKYDVWKKAEKDYSLKYNALIDSKYNKEMLVNKDWEEKFSNAKNHFKIIEEKKAKVLNDSRIEKIKIYVENAEQMDFKEFSDEDFDDFVFGKKTKFEQRIAEEKAEAERVELDRIEKEKAIEAQRLENEKLKLEAEQKEAELQKERLENEAKLKAIQDEADKKAREEKQKQEAILKAEQEAKAKIEAELKSKKDAELKAENERIEAEDRAKKEEIKLAKAPIKKQLAQWVELFEIPLPTTANETSIDIAKKFNAFKEWAKLEIEKL